MEITTATFQKPGSGSALARVWRRFVPLQLIVVMASVGFMVGVTGAMTVLLLRGNFALPTARVVLPAPPPVSVHAAPAVLTAISPFFTPEVQRWSSQIVGWGRQYGLDPNVIATVMQIESCGDPQAGSGVGAQGLFQVMPFHFQSGDDMHDPATNARAGLDYLKQGLSKARGHVGLALAGYNGGHGLIGLGWSDWPSETRRYYLWGSGIYLDALRGRPSSASLQSWLSAGGSILCGQAAARLSPSPTPPLIVTPVG